MLQKRQVLYPLLNDFCMDPAAAWYMAGDILHEAGNYEDGLSSLIEKDALQYCYALGRMIVNGYIDEMIYERKTIDTYFPFAELKKRSYISPKAPAVDKGLVFSQLIRVGLPGKEMK